jgi:acyl dehydratase
VRYAGASHDFNPNHHDEVYAKASGNKAVFGMGMLAGGYCARLLTDWLGDGALRGLRIRFASRFWPGDVLTCSAAVTGKREVAGEGSSIASSPPSTRTATSSSAATPPPPCRVDGDGAPRLVRWI